MFDPKIFIASNLLIERLTEYIVLPWMHEDLRKNFRANKKHILAVHGAAGVGKTCFAKALANVLQWSFVSYKVTESRLNALPEATILHLWGFESADISTVTMRQWLDEIVLKTTQNCIVVCEARNELPENLNDWRIFSVNLSFPEFSEREALFRLFLNGKPQSPLDFKMLAENTAGMSGAQIQNCVELVTAKLLRKAVEIGGFPQIQQKDLVDELMFLRQK